MEGTSVPVVLTIGGTDPSGGAGIQADIEAVSSMGCHAAPVVTAVTVQDTQNVHGYSAMPGELVMEQARAALEDLSVSAIKVGMLGSVEIAEALHGVFNDYPDLPLVVDPVIAAGSGDALAEQAVIDAMTTLLFPSATLITPNSVEARRLAPEADTLDACGMALVDRGSEFVLVTGAHEDTPQVINRVYGNHRVLDTFSWERLSGHYHGSGCTLASAITGLLAQGREVLSSLYEAQHYTWETLHHGYRIGRGQLIPNRLFWAG